MASPNSTFTELVTTTFNKHRTEISDNNSKNNALLRVLLKSGNVTMEDGGLSIVVPLEYANNSTYQRYSGLDTLDISQSNVLTSAQYQWKNAAMHIVSSGEELRKNSGSSQIIKLAKARMKNAIRSFKNNYASDVYGDGTLPNQIGGLQLLVADAGTGTVGGINSSTETWWQNVVQSAAAPLGGGSAITVSATTIESLFLPLYLRLVRDGDMPNLGVLDYQYFTFYEMSQTSLKRYTNDNTLDGGAVSLKYKGMDMVFDGGNGMPANHAYFLNTEYLGLTIHEAANMTILDGAKPINQDGVVIPIIHMSNLTCSNRSLQGVAKA